MATFDFPSYMKTLAEQHKDILHSEDNRRFYKMSFLSEMEGVLTNLLTAKTPAVGINDTLEGRVFNNNADRTIDRQLYTYYIFGRTSLFDHTERKNVTKECKTIAVDFSQRIIADHHSDFSLTSSHGLRHLDVESFTYRTMGNLPDGLLAIIVSFVIDAPFKHNSANNPWNKQE